MKKRGKIFLWGFFLPLALAFFSFQIPRESEHPVFQLILQKFSSYFERLPQQKVYLHLDKNNYSADETVWFKAYLVNASTHTPDSSTSNLYIELINPSGYIVQNKLVKMENGFGNGDFRFQDTIPEGIYKLRAFTEWMRNADEDFFFEREIYLANPDFRSYITREEVARIKREKRKTSKKELKFDVQFLPEGGHLLAGIENRLGIKALNELGVGSQVEGEIIDSKGNSISSFKTSQYGLGSVSLSPELKEKYTALVNTGNGRTLKIPVPEALETGISLSVDRLKSGFITINLLHNFTPGQLPPNTLYFLLGQCRERTVFSHEFDLKTGNFTVEVPTSEFPTGIIHFTLFNLYSQPVSERLVFVNNHDELQILAEPSKTIVSSREKVNAKVRVTDKNNHPVSGNFSLAVAISEESQEEENIVSSLLLGSDLKGKVENPQYYFTNTDDQKLKELDDLMLTQGWRRFQWSGVLSDVKVTPKHENEKGITISGKITRQFFDIPLRDIVVTLYILNEYNDVFTTRSGMRGAFRFDNMNYRDTVAVSIEAVKANGRKNLVIYVDEKSNERDDEMNYRTAQDLRRREARGHYTEPEDPDADDPFYEENHRIWRLHQEPSAQNVIIVDETMMSYRDVGEIIQGRIPGVNVSGKNVTIRGVSSFYNSSPLFLVDGMQVDGDFAMSMSPFDVERIEVIKGPETAVYGSRGGNGVIAIYTRRGKFMKRGVLDFEMLGYATPREYYSPGFEYRADDPFEDDRKTILWLPFVTTDSTGEASVSFYTSDVKADYLLKIEGISSRGIPGAGSAKIQVR